MKGTHYFNRWLQVAAVTAALQFSAAEASAQTGSDAGDTVSIQVDFNTKKGPMKPIWAFFGYD